MRVLLHPATPLMAAVQRGVLDEGGEDVRFIPSIKMNRLIRPFALQPKLSPRFDVGRLTPFVPRKHLVDLNNCHLRKRVALVHEHTDSEVEVPHIYAACGNFDAQRRVVLHLFERGHLKRINLLAENGDVAFAGVKCSHRRSGAIHVVLKLHTGLVLLKPLFP